jgi:hypothetical protein
MAPSTFNPRGRPTFFETLALALDLGEPFVLAKHAAIWMIVPNGLVLSIAC